jgi:hypothetical protein
MPYLNIDTNQAFDEAPTQAVIKKAPSFINGLFGKPESYMMISLPWFGLKPGHF